MAGDLIGSIDVGGVLKGAADFAKGIREAITGKAILDPNKQAELLAQSQAIAAQLEQGIMAAQQGQIDINKIDASSGKWWQSGWRPYIGWVCGTVIALYYIPQSIVSVIVWVMMLQANSWKLVPFPITFDFTQLIVLTLNLLGLGYLRSQDKKSVIDNILGGGK